MKTSIRVISQQNLWKHLNFKFLFLFQKPGIMSGFFVLLVEFLLLKINIEN